MKVLVAEQVVAGLHLLHPDHRKVIRAALRELGHGRGDTKELSGTLAGFYRLRIGRYRVVYCYRDKHIEVLFLEQRSIVYELFRP